MQIAAFVSIGCASIGTWRRSQTGSGVTSPAVGGAVWVCSALTVTMASEAPAAPSRCPIMDFVDDTRIWSRSSPRARRMAAVSAGSFLAVPVPWEFR